MKFGDEIDWDAEARRAAAANDTVPDEIVHQLRHALGPGTPRLVDCGCNIGRFVEAAQRRDFVYTGVDQAHEALMIATRRHIGTRFIEAMLWDNWPSLTETCDAAMTVAVLQHNHYSDQLRILERIAEAVRPGGYFGMQEATLLVDAGFIGDMRCHSRKTWILIVEAAGFEYVSGWRVHGVVDDGYLFRRRRIA